MSLTSYRAAPPRDNLWKEGRWAKPAFRGLSNKPLREWKGASGRLFRETVTEHRHRTVMGEKPALRPREPVGSALIAIAHDILAEARAALDDPAEAVAVHGYRKAMKRLRAFLRLLEPFLGAQA